MKPPAASCSSVFRNPITSLDRSLKSAVAWRAERTEIFPAESLRLRPRALAASVPVTTTDISDWRRNWNLDMRRTKDPVIKRTARAKALPRGYPVDEDGTRDRLKSAAMHLFSVRGIDGVTVRNIVAEAGARNGASLHY